MPLKSGQVILAHPATRLPTPQPDEPLSAVGTLLLQHRATMPG